MFVSLHKIQLLPGALPALPQRVRIGQLCRVYLHVGLQLVQRTAGGVARLCLATAAGGAASARQQRVLRRDVAVTGAGAVLRAAAGHCRGDNETII